MDVERIMHTSEVLDVTAFADRVRNYIHSGYQFVKIQGRTIDDDRKINETFLVLSRENNMLVLKSKVEKDGPKFLVK